MTPHKYVRRPLKNSWIVRKAEKCVYLFQVVDTLSLGYLCGHLFIILKWILFLS